MWSLLTGATNVSLRNEWSMTPFGEDTKRSAYGGDAAYMLYPYKLLVGKVRQAGWCGPTHPNVSQPWDSFNDIIECNNTASLADEGIANKAFHLEKLASSPNDPTAGEWLSFDGESVVLYANPNQIV